MRVQKKNKAFAYRVPIGDYNYLQCTLLTFISGSALKCYSCFADETNTCEDLELFDEYTCKNGDNVCTKTLLDGGKIEIYIFSFISVSSFLRLQVINCQIQSFLFTIFSNR